VIHAETMRLDGWLTKDGSTRLQNEAANFEHQCDATKESNKKRDPAQYRIFGFGGRVRDPFQFVVIATLS
jgi:hypothetical protein